MPAYDPTTRTRILARILGPYLVTMAIALATQQETLPLLLTAFMQDKPLVLAIGAFTLAAGLTIVAVHHHWTSAPAIVISLGGILGALKGAMLVIVPGIGSEMTGMIMRMPALLLVAAGAIMVAGLWLSFVGWRSNA